MKNALFSFVIGFLFCVIIAPFVIKVIRKLKAGQNILSYVDAHMSKQGTPTMGGIIFILGAVVCYLCFMQNSHQLSTLVLLGMLGYGLVGFLDDFLKIKLKHNEGLKAYQKALGQVGVALIIALFVYLSGMIGTDIVVPFTFTSINLGWFIIPFAVFVFVAVTNSVNLTDGLDGLAGGVSFSFLASFVVILYIYVQRLTIDGASVVFIQEVTSIMVLTAGFAGCILAYLCFNCYPARVFMGDTGSLAIGGFIASMIVLTKLYLYMPLIGLMFVLNTVSVIIQVGYYKLTHKRIFAMAPLHHHFEKKGVNETRIVAVYIIITIVVGLASIALSL